MNAGHEEREFFDDSVTIFGDARGAADAAQNAFAAALADGVRRSSVCG